MSADSTVAATAVMDGGATAGAAGATGATAGAVAAGTGTGVGGNGGNGGSRHSDVTAVARALASQFEFYFSNANLWTDQFMQTEIAQDSEGCTDSLTLLTASDQSVVQMF